MVFPGTGSHSPSFQSFTDLWAISPGVSWRSGAATMSFTGAGKCFTDSSLTFRAIMPKIFQSGFDSHAGGTAASRQLTKECMSVVFRSDFSYQVAAGRTMSE